jgi:hypothetical protein
MDESQKVTMDALKAAIRQALRTLAAVPDPDNRFLGWRSGWVVPYREAAEEAYGYHNARIPRFVPSPKDIMRMWVVLDWLSWVRQEEGEDSMRRIFAWGYGAPLWKIGQREERGCSDETVRRRIDRTLAAIIGHFGGEKIDVDLRDPPKLKPVHAFTDRPTGTDSTELQPAKGYVYGMGFVRGGRRIRAQLSPLGM